jgi:hypothetical protein
LIEDPNELDEDPECGSDAVDDCIVCVIVVAAPWDAIITLVITETSVFVFDDDSDVDVEGVDVV